MFKHFEKWADSPLTDSLGVVEPFELEAIKSRPPNAFGALLAGAIGE